MSSCWLTNATLLVAMLGYVGMSPFTSDPAAWTEVEAALAPDTVAQMKLASPTNVDNTTSLKCGKVLVCDTSCTVAEAPDDAMHWQVQGIHCFANLVDHDLAAWWVVRRMP